MKKNNKKIILILIVLSLILVGLGTIYFIYNSNSNILTLEENKWIEENKYDVIDIALLNDIPILSYDGEGLVYDYLDYISKSSSLKFNVVSYKLDGSVDYNYKMEIVDKIDEKHIPILKDNLVLISNNNIQYSKLSEINNIRIGVLSNDKQLISEYINNETITYVEYNNYTDLKNSIIDSKNNLSQVDSSSEVDAIIILKTVFIKELIENNFTVSYHFNDLQKYFTLTTSGEKDLNSVLSKYFSTWKKDNFESVYNDRLLLDYYRFKKLSDVDQKKLKSKSYVYGFINYGIFNYLDGSKISGINGLVLKDFKDFSKLSINYTRYNSINKLIDDFNSNKIDFIFDIVKEDTLKDNVYSTINVFDKNLVVIGHNNNNTVIDTEKSLIKKEILVLKDSYVEDYLVKNNIKFKSYNNMNDLISDYDVTDIVITDIENYNYYKTTAFKKSRILYDIDLDDKYNYIISDIESNKVFEDLFNFYLSFKPIKNLIANNYDDIAYRNIDITYFLIIIIIILMLYLILDFTNHIKVMVKSTKKNKKIKMTKEERIKYIDQLTSLKNRTYLNSKIETWDNSEVYPQSIIIIDLNNVSYINDNYGREEGDKVITEAANILIQNQLSNTEIIRTDGNEFLVYMVGYSEKQIISYLRKLNKEFKNLSHGFGAASGYSIIKDAIKTIDDAVNEATLAMKENKEDIEY